MRADQGFRILPLLALSLSFTAGIWLASSILQTLTFWLVLAGIGLLMLVLLGFIRWASARTGRWTRSPSISQPEGRLPKRTLAVLCLVAVFLGAARFQAVQPEFSYTDLAWYNDTAQQIEVVGLLTAPPDVRDTHIQVEVEAEQIVYPDEDIQQVAGRVLAFVPLGVDWHYGDRVRLWGQLQTPPEDDDFSYKAYLARQQIYSYMPFASASLIGRGGGSPFLRVLFSFRDKGLNLIYRYLPDPEASLLSGIVLGMESGIPQDVDQAFKDTGTTHIIAISGFNITIVAGLFSILFGRILGPRRGAVAAALAIGLYTVMVGSDAAVVRAAVMGGLSLFARQVGRRQHGLNSLAVTAGLMLLANPMLLWDVGFQLSFAATLGLIVYAGPWEEAFEGWLAGKFSPELGRRLTGPVSEYVLLTLAAQLTTLPLIVYHFGRLSLVSLPANIAILPAQPPVMVLGGLAVLAGSVWQPVGQVLAYAVWPFVAYTIRVVEWFAGWDGGVRVLGQVDPLTVAGLYFLMFLLTLYWDQFKQTLRKNVRPVLIFSILAVTAVLVWQAALSRPDGRLHLTMLDVGNGEAILVQTPEGRYILVGGGESATGLSDGLGRALPLFHRQLDLLVVAGTQSDQVNALPAVMPRYPPAQVWWAGGRESSRPARLLYAWLQEEQIPLQTILPGQVLDLGSGVELRAVSLGEDGAVLRLSWGQFAGLLPLGGLETFYQSPERSILSQNLSVLLLAHSGSGDANPPDWLAGVRPKIAWISVDALNRSGLPDDGVPDMLAGITILRTDLNGSVEVVTDGQQLWVYTEK